MNVKLEFSCIVAKNLDEVQKIEKKSNRNNDKSLNILEYYFKN